MVLSKKDTSILYLDDDAENLLGFETSFDKDFNVFVANNVNQALEILELNKISVFLVDIKMPDEDGISFISRINNQFPDIIYILVTAYADLNIAVTALNKNIFYHFVHKPWDHFELKTILSNAVEKYNLRIEKKELLISLECALEKEKNANELKNVFLKNISHEIRTPVNGILGFSDIAKEHSTDNQTLYYLDIIHESGRQLLYAVQGVLDSSLIISNQLKYQEESFNIYSLIQQIEEEYISRYEGKYKVKILNKINEGCTLSNDKGKIERVLNCLINNALIYSNFNEVTVELKNNVSENECVVSVSNAGSRIDLDNYKLIFEPFRQIDTSLSRQYGGSGLGLFIAKSYVEYLGGKIWLDSDSDQKTTFYFTLNGVCS